MRKAVAIIYLVIGFLLVGIVIAGFSKESQISNQEIGQQGG